MKTFKIPYNFIQYIIILLFCISSSSCEQTKQAEPVKAKNQRTYFEAYSLFREAFKQENYTKAHIYLKLLMELNPCFTKTPFVDGVKIYKYLIENTANPNDQQKYMDALAQLYKLRINCFGE